MAAVALLASCNKKGEGTTPTEDSLSTAYGTMAGYGIKMQVSGTPDSVNYDEFLKGLEKALQPKPILLSTHAASRWVSKLVLNSVAASQP